MRVIVCSVALLLAVGPSGRQAVAQDTSAIDRGVRIGIIYRPGVRPGLVMLPRTGMGLDSVRAMISRIVRHISPGELRLRFRRSGRPTLVHNRDWHQSVRTRFLRRTAELFRPLA